MRTSVDVDKTAAAVAAVLLGTSSLKETINEALHEIVRMRKRTELALQLRKRRLTTPLRDRYNALR